MIFRGIIHIVNIKDFRGENKAKILFFQDTDEHNKLLDKIYILTFIVILLIIILLIWVVNKQAIGFENKILNLLNSYVLKLKEKENVMIAQSRHAAMGEMISMIAHQWRQPLSVISMEANNLLVDVELDSLEKDLARGYAKEVILQTEHLSKTIDDFRNFFKSEKNLDTVLVKEIFDSLFEVIGKSISNNNIKVNLNYDENLKIITYSKELMHILINLVKNSKEALVEKDIQNKEINISVQTKDELVLIEVCDNAGGIKKEILDKIFEPYFTTKDENIGTGLGLYICKTILQQHLFGTIEVYNCEKNDGACFKIVLPKELKE